MPSRIPRGWLLGEGDSRGKRRILNWAVVAHHNAELSAFEHALVRYRNPPRTRCVRLKPNGGQGAAAQFTAARSNDIKNEPSEQNLR